ncbi:MAG: T9SS type B sorting domain-containing protein, partial [Chitinophagales bacterium]
TTTFSVRVTDINGCIAEDFLTVFVAPTPIVPDLEVEVTICENDTLSVPLSGLTGVVGYTYQWTPTNGLDNPTSPSPIATINQSVDYNVVVSNDAGCTVARMVSISATSSSVDTQLESPLFIVNNIPVKLDPEGDFSDYQWSTGSKDSVLTVTQAGEYTVTVFDENGCTSTANAVVKEVLEAPYAIPNAFTPNGDGRNDVFKVLVDSEDVASINYSIYDRYGYKLLTINDLDAAWDGTYNDQTCELGVYVYAGIIILNDDTEIDFKGNVMLIR